jgi:hypothetical protein
MPLAGSGLLKLDSCAASPRLRLAGRWRDAERVRGRALAQVECLLGFPAYANGQRYLSKNGPERERYSDADASWGHRSAVSTRKGGGFYGYRVHAAVCARTGLPLAWQVRSAREHESLFVAALLDTLHRRGFQPEMAALDMGYDNNRVYAECEECNVAPVIPLRQTPEVKRGNHGAPTCEHGRGRSRARTTNAAQPNGAARPGRAPPSPSGSRPTGCARSSLGRRAAGATSTTVAPLSSASSDA